MKLFKKSLAILLCIMMIGAISPFNAFAADEAVTSIVLQAETIPAVGAGVFTPKSFSVNEEEYKASYVESIEAYWYSSDAYSEDRNNYTYCEDTAFAEGKAYCLYLVLYTEYGYPIEEGATVTLTTPYGDVDGVIESYFDDENIGVSFFFDVLEMKEAEDYFGIRINEPTIGGTPDTTPEMSDWSKDCTVSFISWRINDGTGATPTVFENDKEYILRVKFTPKPGYYFPEDCRVVVNGYDADFVSRDEATGTLIYDYLYYMVDYAKVYSIDITGGVATYNDVPVGASNPGKVIWIKADTAPEGKVFDHWEHTGLRNFEDYEVVAPNAPFIMPAHNVKIWAVYADESVYIGNTLLKDGTYLANGATAVQTSKPEGGYAYFKDDVLTLENFEYSGDGYAKGGNRLSVYSNYSIDVVLKGNNKITVKDDSSTYDEGIWIDGDSNFAAGASDSLTISGGDCGLSAETLEMSGGNYVLEGKEDAIYCWDVEAENVNFNLESVEYDAFYVDGDLHLKNCVVVIDNCPYGLYSYYDMILDNCTVDIRSKKSAIYSEENLAINGGEYYVVGGRYGIAAYDELTITDSVILAVSTNTEDDDYYFAIHSDCDSITIDTDYTVIVSDEPDGSNPQEGFSADADYVKIGNPSPNCIITVTGGTASKTQASLLETVTIKADDVPAGKYFSHWEVKGANVEDEKNPETKIVVTSKNVTAEAVYDECGCNCHKGGIAGFFFKIVLFFQKLFGQNLICECGMKH